MMSTESLVFDWSNFEAFVEQSIVDEQAEKQIIDAPFGRFVGYTKCSSPFDGEIGYFIFDESCRMIVLDGVWREPVSLLIRDGNWFRFNFSLAASVGLEMKSGDVVDISAYSWRILNHPPETDVHEFIEDGTQTRWVTIICSRDYIEKVAGLSLSDMPELQEVIGADLPEASIHRDFNIRSRMTSVTSDVLKHSYSNGLDVAYAKSRALHLLAMALKELLTPQAVTSVVRLSARDVTAINEAREILEVESLSPPSVLELSKRVGINRNKLYYGFKSIVGCSVSDHIKHCRLEHSRHLLRHSEKSVGEIAHEVGFSHQCNFATAFKREYGETPRRFRDTDPEG